jgi:hypothetical protein
MVQQAHFLKQEDVGVRGRHAPLTRFPR